MNSIITDMLNNYNVEDLNEKKNAIKEIMQEIILCGLSRAGFFQKAAFYGGTALRIFYGLDRFSEDLDFSLMSVNNDFSFLEYLPILRKEVLSFGFNVDIVEKEKTKESNIHSAFLKANTREHMILFYASDPSIKNIASNEIIIKFEVDTNPPFGAIYEHKYCLLPSPHDVVLYDMPSLFAGKIHAVICRGWNNRTKGRDLYDYVFYLSHDAKLNVQHLKARLVQSNVWDKEKDISIDDVKRMLRDHFDVIDYEQAKNDVKPFIKDTKVLDMWSAEFFKDITNGLSGA